MSRKLLIYLAVLSFAMTLLSSCTSLNSVSLTSIPEDRKHKVSAETSKLIFLAFNFNNDFVNIMVKKLRRKCKNGKVQGILTKDEVTYYFLFFLYRRSVTATGYCVKDE